MAYIMQLGPLLFGPLKINIHDWQLISRVLKKDKVVSIVINFHLYNINNSTIEELHEANSKGKKYKIEKEFIFKRNVLSCDVCGGKGTIDWIENIIKPTHDYKNIYKYSRHSKGTVYKLTTRNNGVFFSSTPYIKKGFELCSKCRGSGLYYTTLNQIELSEPIDMNGQLIKGKLHFPYIGRFKRPKNT